MLTERHQIAVSLPDIGDRFRWLPTIDGVTKRPQPMRPAPANATKRRAAVAQLYPRLEMRQSQTKELEG
jgi:hypothetical protein